MRSFDFDVDKNEGEPLKASGVAPGRFVMWRQGETAFGDPLGLRCLLGDSRPKIIRGYGGWATIKRDGRRAISSFDGSETPAIQVELLLENRVMRDRVALAARGGKVRRLESLAGFEKADDEPPPEVQWIANVPHDYTGAPARSWVVESLEWGDDNSSDRGTLLWAKATIVLGMFADSSIPGLGKSSGFVRRTLKEGWSLRDFARKHLGDAKRWRDVASLNRDNPKCPQSPDFKPKRAIQLLVPPREPTTKKKKKKK